MKVGGPVWKRLDERKKNRKTVTIKVVKITVKHEFLSSNGKYNGSIVALFGKNLAMFMPIENTDQGRASICVNLTSVL